MVESHQGTGLVQMAHLNQSQESYYTTAYRGDDEPALITSYCRDSYDACKTLCSPELSLDLLVLCLDLCDIISQRM